MSSRDMTINEIKAVDKDFGDNHTIKVSGFKDGGGRVTNRDLLIAINKLCDRVGKLEQFNQFVIEQFKKHGWIK